MAGLAGCIGSKKAAIRRLDNAKTFKPFDAIIVPGIPFKNGAWDSVMKARVLWSYILYKNGYAKNIIFCFGKDINDPGVVALRPRSIGVVELEKSFIITFLEAPNPMANNAMESWAKALKNS